MLYGKMTNVNPINISAIGQLVAKGLQIEL